MTAQYFKIKAAIVCLYLGSITATVLWVFLGMPNNFILDFKAEMNSVPGDFGGRPVVVVTNRGGSAWQDVRIIVNKLCIYTAPSLSASEQLNLPLDAFSNIYTVPRDWNRPPFHGLSHSKQSLSTACPVSTVSTIEVKSAQGVAKVELSEGKR